MTHSDKMDRKTGAGIQKPNSRLDYNKTISGIDPLQVEWSYRIRSRGVKWYRKNVFH